MSVNVSQRLCRFWAGTCSLEGGAPCDACNQGWLEIFPYDNMGTDLLDAAEDALRELVRHEPPPEATPEFRDAYTRARKTLQEAIDAIYDGAPDAL